MFKNFLKISKIGTNRYIAVKQNIREIKRNNRRAKARKARAANTERIFSTYNIYSTESILKK